ncbi:MAG: helix-turn-helix transcriptional regulator [Bacteroidetes bacterium]|nr:helix-turn-helix transcriptional regulator [Bacteroidota bacterium]
MSFDSFKSTSMERSSGILRALAHPLRISLLNYIDSNQPVKVLNIHTDLNLDQSIASQHLRVLRDSGLVKTTRDGKFVFYIIDSTFVFHTLEAIKDFDVKTLAHRKKKR